MGLFQTQLPPNFGGPYTIGRHPLGTTGAERKLGSAPAQQTQNLSTDPASPHSHLLIFIPISHDGGHSSTPALAFLTQATLRRFSTQVLAIPQWGDTFCLSSTRRVVTFLPGPFVSNTSLPTLQPVCHEDGPRHRDVKQALVLKLSCSPLSNRGQCWEHLS